MCESKVDDFFLETNRVLETIPELVDKYVDNNSQVIAVAVVLKVVSKQKKERNDINIFRI